MRISVALCTYNGEEYLGEQLESILQQTRKPDELVICDDRSSDSTWSILEEFAKQAPFKVRLVRNDSNLGSTENFAKAIGLCDGDIIFMSDQDDFWLPKKLATIMAVFQAQPDCQMVFSDSMVADEQLRPGGKTLWQMLDFSKEEHAEFLQNSGANVLMRRNVATGATMAVSRQGLRHVFPFSEAWVHDEWMAFLIAASGKVRLIDEPLIYYRQHRGQQIGCKEKSWYMRLRDGVSDGSIGRCRDRVTKWAELIARLEVMREDLLDKRLPELLADRVDHWRARLALPAGKAARFRQVCKELQRYKRYETGMIALKDWIES